MTVVTEQRIFMLTLVATGPSDPYLAIRALLKLALRRHGLRCTQARELPPSNPKPDRTQANENIDQSPARGRRHGYADRGCAAGGRGKTA